jgi:cytoskeletal protein RodZ
VKPSTSPGASASGMPRATGNPVEEQPKDIGGWFSGLFTNALSFPTILVASGIGLLILIILISLILAATRRRKQSSPVVPNRPQTATYERSLQQRITELQANKSGATPASTTPIRPITPTAPVAPAAQPQTPMVSSTTPMTPPPSTRQPMSTTPMPGADSQAKPVSVLDRMKQKGITTPGSS